MSVDHYENFPVASLLLPARLRPAVEIIYAFARSADDIADEGDASAEERLRQLHEYEIELDHIDANRDSESSLFKELSKVIAEYQLPLQSFRDLLSAFKQDVVKTRYADFPELLDYCARSANPVGTLMLQLYCAATPENLRDSDAICSALQLINFLQDVAIDWQKQRVYLPACDLNEFGINENYIDNGILNDAWRSMMRFQISRARSMMISGSSLAKRLPGRLGWELRLVIQGGLRILEKIETVDGDIFMHRPKLKKWDWLKILWRSLFM